VNQIAQYRGTGKRKTSVARVILRPGDGKTWINGKTLDQYFPRLLHRKAVLLRESRDGLGGRACGRAGQFRFTVLPGSFDLRDRNRKPARRGENPGAFQFP